LNLRVLWLWAPVAVYMAAIFGASSISEPPGVPGGPSDKILHAAVYAVLGALLVRALAGGLTGRVTARTALLAAFIASGYGITDEVHQYFVPLRNMDAVDVLADAAGAGAAALALYVRDIIRTRHDL
jgi:VanZ family protein